MPISNTKDILTFVNSLESQLNALKDDMNAWDANKSQVLSSIDQVEKNRVNALSAIVKAEDALAEINTATFGVVAQKGLRLQKLLESLKQQMIDIASNATGVGGGDPVVNEEVHNAVASVDLEIEDGLKLDYRLRRIQQMAEIGERDFIVPYKLEVSTVMTTNTISAPSDNGVEFVNGDVTVLNGSGEKGIIGSNNALIAGKIDATGLITLDEAPNQPVRLYFPVRLKFKDIPDDFLYYMMQMMVSKASPLMEMLLKFENEMNHLISDIEAMKGQNWTIDHSIMDNQKQIIKEAITPKGLSIQVQDGMVHAIFSYNDHPYLDHFVLEKWDETKKDWVPADGEYGIIPK